MQDNLLYSALHGLAIKLFSVQWLCILSGLLIPGSRLKSFQIFGQHAMKHVARGTVLPLLRLTTHIGCRHALDPARNGS